MATYYVRYLLVGQSQSGVCVAARNMNDACIKAMYEIIPEIEGRTPFCVWAFSVTYDNGNYRELKGGCWRG